MNSITKTLLVGAAFCALATVPAVAGDVPDIHVVALHPGQQTVLKTRMHKGGVTHTTSTVSLSTSVPASDLHKKVELGTLFTFLCGQSGKVKVKITKKATYGKAGIFTTTTGQTCDGVSQVFYGNTYKLTNPEGEGKIDSFVSSLIRKFEYKGAKYKETVNLDVSVAIGD